MKELLLLFLALLSEEDLDKIVAFKPTAKFLDQEALIRRPMQRPPFKEDGESQAGIE